MKIFAVPFMLLSVSVMGTCQTTHNAHLTFGASSTPGVTYNVYRADGKLCASNPTFVKVGNTASLVFDDMNLPAKTSFAYVVRATDGTDESVNSNCADGTTGKDPIGTPGSLVVVIK